MTKYNYGGTYVKVFISWSGERSCKVAQILKEWIPYVIQDVEPYFSSEDIDKGARWNTDISKELEVATFGILCVTKENMESAWLNFEAGALSKKLDTSKVCPLLFDIKPAEVTSKSPISQFQMTVIKKEDIYKLFYSMNLCLGENSLSDERLRKTYDMVWPNIEKELSKIEPIQETKEPQNDDNTSLLLENILDTVRSQQLLLKDPSRFLPQEYVNSILDFDRVYSNILNQRVPREVGDRLDFMYERLSLMKLEKEPDDSEYRELLEGYLELTREALIRSGITGNSKINRRNRY